MSVRGLVVLLLAVAAVVAAPVAAAESIDGYRAKSFAGEITALGKNRLAGSLKEYRASTIIKRELESLGYAVERQRFRIPGDDTSRNVIARTPGPLRVVIVGHMDGVHNTKAANDNASGVAGVVEVARVLKDMPGLLLAAVGAEERVVTGSPYHLGSRRLIRSLTDADLASIRLVVSLDMIAVGTVLNVRGLESSPNRSARKLLNTAERLGYRVSYLRDTGVSDHAEFTRAGVPATLLTWRWDSCWHQPCDRLHRLDPRKLRKAARLTMVAARAVLD
jgi:Zn-dependent M28 family amino/carboxypeptidase